MDKHTAKEILSAYRSNGADATDDNLADALNFSQRDPEMKQWFESERAFDQSFSASLKDIKGPEAGKKAILATAIFENVKTPDEPIELDSKVVSINWWRYTAIAALLALAALFSFQHISSQDPDLASVASNSWLDSVRLLADSALPLDKRGDEVAQLQDWLTNEGAPFANTLPASLTMETDLAGCRVFDLPNGEKASLLCFTQGSDFVHVFVVRKSDLKNQSVPEQSWERKGDWNLFAWSEGDMLMTVASKMPTEKITPLLSRA